MGKSLRYLFCKFIIILLLSCNIYLNKEKKLNFKPKVFPKIHLNYIISKQMVEQQLSEHYFLIQK